VRHLSGDQITFQMSFELATNASLYREDNCWSIVLIRLPLYKEVSDIGRLAWVCEKPTTT